MQFSLVKLALDVELGERSAQRNDQILGLDFSKKLCNDTFYLKHTTLSDQSAWDKRDIIDY